MDSDESKVLPNTASVADNRRELTNHSNSNIKRMSFYRAYIRDKVGGTVLSATMSTWVTLKGNILPTGYDIFLLTLSIQFTKS
jgi:hypothetical protein